ncbi:hypothetical protein M9H77_27774 [Catharanthus roseus]|uniref:Uncharacterized protein n=1 Tax=Catharanthus roseus TaxID=4058 RepID=A0ACC0AHL9_CATRO|nr:hypothetical protein M9H77_27774 [Catharanthus roseus]
MFKPKFSLSSLTRYSGIALHAFSLSLTVRFYLLQALILNGKVRGQHKHDRQERQEAQHSSLEQVMDTNIDSIIDSLTSHRLEFQNLNNNGDNLLTEKEAKLEDIILASTHGENIIYEVHSRISSKIIPKFYKAYAKEDGFGIRRSLSHKDNEGRRPSDKTDVIIKTHRPEI